MQELKRSTSIDCNATADEYLNKSDWRINANANINYSNSGLISNISGKVIANYWLDSVFSKEAGDAHRSGDIHIHDLDSMSPYCCGHDLQRLLEEGFNGVPGRVNSRSPKHFREALYQMANYIGILQSEWAGAQAFSSFDTYLAPYVFFDMQYGGMSRSDIKKAILNFIYNLNVPSRWGQCVPSSYKCLKGDGTWASYNELKDGDEIYVVDIETGALKKDKLTNINIFDAPGKMHRYQTDNLTFDVTPNHRVIFQDKSTRPSIKESDELIKKGSVEIPVAIWNRVKTIENLAADNKTSFPMVELIGHFIAGGKITKGRGKTHLKFIRKDNMYGADTFEDICKLLNIKFSKKHNVYANEYIFELTTDKDDVTNTIIDIIKDAQSLTKYINSLNIQQADIILDLLTILNGTFNGEYWRIIVETSDMQDVIAYLATITGRGSAKITEGKQYFVDVYKKTWKSCEISEVESEYQKVWCPTTNTGTFVCMNDKGQVFLTGNSPFSNVTLDMTVPRDMQDQPPMRDGNHYFVSIFEDYFKNKKAHEKGYYIYLISAVCERLNDADGGSRRPEDYTSEEKFIDLISELTYKHFQKEIDIIDIAFYECLNEGDTLGQPFTFPIPTVSITEDFDWDSEKATIIFENAARVGSSYFQNFIGSQYFRDENGELTIPNPNAFKPDDVRSMAFLGSQEIIFRNESGVVSKAELRSLVDEWNKAADNDKPKYEFLINGEFKAITEMFDIDYRNYPSIVEIKLENGYIQKFSTDHKCIVLNSNNEYETKLSQDLVPGDRFIISGEPWDIRDDEHDTTSYVIIGLYLAFGEIHLDKPEQVHFTINKNHEGAKSIVSLITTAAKGASATIVEDNDLYKIIVDDADIASFILKYVGGSNLTDKHLLPAFWNLSYKSRHIAFQGILLTPTLNRSFLHVIYVLNEQLCNDIITLAASLGVVITYDKISSQTLNVNLANKENLNIYDISIAKLDHFDSYYIVPIKEVNLADASEIEHVYNFTIDTDKHWVELPNGIISHQCCRLQLDLTELRQKGGGLFGSGSQTGSIGVCTINTARLGYLYKGDIEALYNAVDDLLDICKDTLEKKRAFVTEMNARGLYPYSRRYIRTLDTFFSTIGINGMNEMVRNFTNDEHDITTEFGQKFSKDFLDYVRERIVEFQKETGNLYNLEAVPAEGTTYRLAKADKAKFPDIIQANMTGDAPYYTNSSQLPVGFTSDVFTALDLQDDLQTKWTGGTVFHVYINEPLDAASCKVLVKKILSNYRLPYISITPTFSICPVHGRLEGEHDFCPLCDKEIIRRHAEEVDINL